MSAPLERLAGYLQAEWPVEGGVWAIHQQPGQVLLTLAVPEGVSVTALKLEVTLEELVEAAREMRQIYKAMSEP